MSDTEDYDWRSEYVKLLSNQYRLRVSLESDFRYFLKKLKEARSSSRSKSIEIMNEMIEYLDMAVPKLEEKRREMDKKLDIDSDEFMDGKTVMRHDY